MGLWLDEQRHGNAVVVTQYGVYYEGTFRDNKMSVSSPWSVYVIILTYIVHYIILAGCSEVQLHDYPQQSEEVRASVGFVDKVVCVSFPLIGVCAEEFEKLTYDDGLVVNAYESFKPGLPSRLWAVNSSYDIISSS